MGKRLKNPPVFITIVQVRFNAILNMSEYLPSIQEKFRLASYPDYKGQSLSGMQFVINAEGKPQPVPSIVEQFFFGNVERNHLFTLDTQSLTLQSTQYGEFETFSARFLEGLAFINDIVKLSYSERIGLRYVDRIMPTLDRSISHYLVGSAHGVGVQFGGKSLYSYSESLNEFGDIRLLNRTVIQDGPFTAPADIQLGNLLVEDRFLSYAGLYALLDNDGFSEQRMNFSIATIKEKLERIHDITRTAFWNTVTETARQEWEK